MEELGPLSSGVSVWGEGEGATCNKCELADQPAHVVFMQPCLSIMHFPGTASHARVDLTVTRTFWNTVSSAFARCSGCLPWKPPSRVLAQCIWPDWVVSAVYYGDASFLTTKPLGVSAEHGGFSLELTSTSSVPDWPGGNRDIGSGWERMELLGAFFRPYCF